MSQHDMNIANQTSANARADINNALGALVSLSSGTSAPSTTFANMLWYETDTNTLYIRNEANSGWITLFVFDQSANEAELRSSVVQAVDSAGIVLKTDEGTGRLYVNDNGRVGISVSSPTTALDVSGTVKATAFSGNGASLTGIVTTSTYEAVGTYVFANNNSGGFIGPNTTVSGANLKATSAAGNSTGSTLTGTWRTMGTKTGNKTDFSGNSECTLFLRIS